MRMNALFSGLLVACAIALASCSQMSSTPSAPSALGQPTRNGVIARLTTRDDPTDPAAPALCPAPAPTTAAERLATRDDPTAPPAAPAAPAPAPCTPSPITDLISIVSYFGSGAFNPNPITANMGDSLVFTNTDSHEHHIVLDDGTEVGDVMPGASTAPLTLSTPTASFHCTIHPTMVGTINMPLPADNSYMPPPDDYYGYY